MLLVTPRKPLSNWSAKNKLHVESLQQRGLMCAAGQTAVAIAKDNGRWNALDDVSALTIPDDLEAAFASYPNAQQHWRAFPPSTQRGILEWISLAKKAATRAARVADTARLASQNIRANQWRQPTQRTSG
jgi:uncharacterized protein YdeI (YjbR/CyaY-like superfamily)